MLHAMEANFMTSTQIYRYIGYKAFEELLSTGNLEFKSPLSWPDKYEGLIYRLINRKDVKERLTELASRYTNSPDEAIENITQFSGFMRCQCWTYNRDAVVMWNAYSYSNKAIMISTTKEEMRELPVRLRNIDYVADDIRLNDLMDNLMDKKGIYIDTVFCKKREAFRYENEIRYFLKSSWLRKNEIEDVMRVHVPNMSTFIKGVIVHPEASDKYVEEVSMLCEKYRIKFDGKSKLYDYENVKLL